MASTTAFRNAFRGYNKEAVNEYIEKTDRAFAETEEKLKKEAASLAGENASLKEEIRALNEKIGKYAGLEEKLRLAEEENEALKARYGEMEGEVSLLREKLEGLSEAVSKADREREKADLYDRISGQIGEMMVDANAAKETILRKAKEKAEKDTAAFREKEAKILSKSMEIAAESISGELSKYLDELKSFGEKLSSSLKVMRASVDTRCGDALEKIKSDSADFAKEKPDGGTRRE